MALKCQMLTRGKMRPPGIRRFKSSVFNSASNYQVRKILNSFQIMGLMCGFGTTNILKRSYQGPGCSTIGSGAFVEHGPFKPKGNTLVKNEYSWNKEANMLYLESPAGVGFSYSTNTNFYDHVDDELTAQDNLIFLERWLDMFPTFKERGFLLSGESYGVVYLNRRDVQKALHARLVGVDSWLLCSDFLHYDVQSIQAPTIDLLGTLVKSGIRVLIFSGDQD